VAGQVGEHVYLAEDLEPSIAVDTILRLEQPTTSDLSAEKAGTLRSEKRTRRPAEKQEKLDNAPRTSADWFETGPRDVPGRVEALENNMQRARVAVGDIRYAESSAELCPASNAKFESVVV
jgi:hypothetical protein